MRRRERSALLSFVFAALFSSAACTETPPVRSCVDFSKKPIGKYPTPVAWDGFQVFKPFGGDVEIREEDLLDENNNTVGSARGLRLQGGWFVKPETAHDVFTIRYVSYMNAPIEAGVFDASGLQRDVTDLSALPQATVKYGATYFPGTGTLSLTGGEGLVLEVCAVLPTSGSKTTKVPTAAPKGARGAKEKP